jgi:hypothetical protein
MNSTVLLSPSLPRADEVAAVTTNARSKTWLLALLIALCGILVRVVPEPGFQSVGFDEKLYRTYVLRLDANGLGGYPAITEGYLAAQRHPDIIAMLPPTRFQYIFSAWVWKRAEFGAAPPLALDVPANIPRDPALVSLHRISCVFSVLTMLLAGAVAWRMLGRAAGLGVLALMAFAPLQVHLGQHALIDGFFCFWAMLSLWALWENLRRPDHRGWLALFGGALALMAMTKENSFFIAVALAGLLAANRWLHFGTVTRRLLWTGVLGPLAGVAALVALAGGGGNFAETYWLLASKAQQLPYAIETGDGPWHRYLIDLLIVSPVTLLLAAGAAFRIRRADRAQVFLLGFIAFSYVVMCNVRYGMNLRYATVWDLPLRALAFGQIAWLAQRLVPARATLATILAVAALCGLELRQYWAFFVDANLYELATRGLLEAVKVLK